MPATESLAPVWIVGFSGHRPKPDSPGRSAEEIDACAPQIAEALVEMQRIAEERGGRIELLTGLAEGADLVAVEEAQKLGIPVHAVLPLPIEEFRNDFEPGSPALARMEKCLAIAEAGNEGSMRVSLGSCLRPDCYSDAGYYLISLSDACLFLDNGEAASGRGGTNDMIRIAKNLGRPHWIIDPSDRENPIRRLEEFADEDSADLALLRDIQRFAGPTVEEDTFETLDRAAGQSSKRIRTAAIWTSVAHGCAAMVASFAIIFYGWLVSNFGLQSARILTMLELLFVLAVVVLSLWFMRPSGQDRWLLSRMAAELFRGLRQTRGILDPLVAPIPESHRTWRRFALAASLNIGTELEDDISALRDRYLKKRLDPQIAYFSRSHRKSHKLSRVIYFFFNISTWCAVVSVLAFIYAKFTMPFMEIPGIVKFLPILFPLLAGIASAVNHALEISRRTRRYKAMAESLTKARALLAELDTDSAIRVAVGRIEESIVQEQLEWLASVQTWTEK